MPLQATSGAASYDAFGGGVPFEPIYIEQVFQNWLYTGNGSTQTINNGIDLAGKGGMVWIKSRSNATSNTVFDTVRGATKFVTTDTTNNQDTISDTLTAFNSTGFTLGSDALDGKVNTSPRTYTSWTFRKQPKFFDVVTYTGNGTAGRLIPHNLGSVPGCVIIKSSSFDVTNADVAWPTWHRGLTSGNLVSLSSTAAQSNFLGNANQYFGNGTTTVNPDASNITIGGASPVNRNGEQYVAYLFAHNAGGFGLSGTDNVISCGSFTSDSLGQATVTLNYEPQWVIIKRSDGTSNWTMLDNMRGWAVTSSGDAALQANTSNAETSGTEWGFPTATGFSANVPTANSTFVYIAIRRGPMRTPTTGTSVFSPIASSAATGTAQTTNFPVDMQWLRSRAADATYVIDRLRGISTTPTTASSRTIYTNDTFAEGGTNTSNGWNNTGFSIPSQQGGTSSIYWSFRRAPGFFDEVCYTGTGGTGSRSLSHNLQAVPELVILKSRSGVANWQTGSMFTSTTVTRAVLNRNDDQDLNSLYSGQSIWGGQPTASTFLIDASGSFNTSAATYVAYLFASCPGVSKVGSYTGNGSTQTINCGFTGGARFVMIKRTDSTGDGYVWDSARGIVAGNDPYLLLNSTAAEVTNTDFVDTAATGFEISSTAPAALNANGGTYIFLAIA